ncbi:MAG: hypothetical protein ABSG63_14550 [Spirochaetia bacterium]
MKRPDRLVCVLVLLVLAGGAMPLFAANAQVVEPSQYTLGDQTLSISAGIFLPLFLLPTGTALLAGNPPQLTVGGEAFLNWSAYVAPRIRIGAELGGAFSFDPNQNLFLMLPIIAKASYVFTIYPFEIPVSFGIGMNILKYTDQYYVDLLLKPGASLFWIFNASWAFGLNLNYWFDMQMSSNFRIGNFLEISLSALYHY